MKNPEYDGSKFIVWSLPHPILLHWVLNPGIALVELVFGQRLPKVQLVDKTSDKPLAERAYVPCPHCSALHDGRLWSRGNAFGHWFGFLCPTCEKTIPCMWNLCSWIILLVTFPLWVLPARFLRPKWMAYEKVRLTRMQSQPPIEAKSINWKWKGAFVFGGFMWFITAIVPQVADALRGHPVSWTRLWVQLPIWLLAGMVWGAIMRSWLNKKGRISESTNASDSRSSSS